MSRSATCSFVINMSKEEFINLIERLKVLFDTVKPETLYTYIYDDPETDDGKQKSRFIEFETTDGERLLVNVDKIVAVTPLTTDKEDGVIILYTDDYEWASVVKGKFDDVVRKLTG